ncbi:pyridoxamine 5'-phosphate oxidase, partial [Meredithblackwellia eburnea MCA 4105]
PQKLAQILSHPTYITDGIPSPSSLSPNPLHQFSTWFSEASSHESIVEPEAFALSTVSPNGVPSTRVVLLKEVDERGFVFYTNYESRKGRELFPPASSSSQSQSQGGGKGGYASMAFYWRPLHRSVRIVGRVEKVTREETERYFHSRPKGSQVGAWASRQSQVLRDRKELEDRVSEVEERFGIEIPVPPFWGGVRIVPFEVEFWMGRESRLHDRFRFTREEGVEVGDWKVDRLSP